MRVVDNWSPWIRRLVEPSKESSTVPQQLRSRLGCRCIRKRECTTSILRRKVESGRWVQGRPGRRYNWGSDGRSGGVWEAKAGKISRYSGTGRDRDVVYGDWCRHCVAERGLGQRHQTRTSEQRSKTWYQLLHVTTTMHSCLAVTRTMKGWGPSLWSRMRGHRWLQQPLWTRRVQPLTLWSLQQRSWRT